MFNPTAIKTPLYLQLALALEEQISRGVLRPGERIPSVRSFSRQRWKVRLFSALYSGI